MSLFKDEDMGSSDNDEIMLDVKELNSKQPQEASSNNSTNSSESKNIVIINDSNI